MRQHIGSYDSSIFGRVHAFIGHYGSADGPLAVWLEHTNGEPVTKLSVNMYVPECSHDSRELPPGCFYCRTWAENDRIAEEALRISGLFVLRADLPEASSGHVAAPVWQLAPGVGR